MDELNDQRGQRIKKLDQFASRRGPHGTLFRGRRPGQSSACTAEKTKDTLEQEQIGCVQIIAGRICRTTLVRARLPCCGIRRLGTPAGCIFEERYAG